MRTLEGSALGNGRRVGIVASRFNRPVVDRLVAGALKALRRAGVADGDLTLAWVPGAFEIPAAARRLAASGACDAVVALGCVLKGETPHFDYVSGAAAEGIARLSAEGFPAAFGVLACPTLEQAMARSGARDNRGADAALAALEMIDVMAQLKPARVRRGAR